jgi:hypothetical protein
MIGLYLVGSCLYYRRLVGDTLKNGGQTIKPAKRKMYDI